MRVKITEDKLHGKCEITGEEFLIHHEGKNGEDITGLAAIASKSPWFVYDNPRFTPGSIQEAQMLHNGRILIAK